MSAIQGSSARSYEWSNLFLAGLVLAGVATLVASGTLADGKREFLSIPYLASGGLGGLAMIGTGLGLLQLQVRRRINAEGRVAIRELARAAASVLDSLPAADGRDSG